MEADKDKEPRKPLGTGGSEKSKKRKRSPRKSLNGDPKGEEDVSEQQQRKLPPRQAAQRRRQDDNSSPRRGRRPRRGGPRRGGRKPNNRNQHQKNESNRAPHFQVRQPQNATIPSAPGNVKSTAGKQPTLQWQTTHPRVPMEIEKKLLSTLVKWKEKERGMILNAGDRYKTIRKKCKQVGSISLSQALSLRRQQMKHLNPNLRMTALGLGQEQDIRKSAELFEKAVERYMRQCNLTFVTEAQQRASLPKGGKSPPTPDFVLMEPTVLSSMVAVQASQKPIMEQHTIKWVEAKMYYGASCLAFDSESAVGTILGTAERYVNLYGTGAMVFMYGCGQEMAQWLLQRGVVALDAHPLDLRNVEKHQRTWCANKSGIILP